MTTSQTARSSRTPLRCTSNVLHAALAGCALLGAASAATPALAQVELGDTGLSLTGTVTGATDYLFRGISQTNNRPAIQGALELSHSSGLYVGAAASNVTFAGTDARQEVDYLAGYRFEVLGISWDIGGIYYSYPGYDRREGQQLIDYVEVMLKAEKAVGPVTIVGFAAYSPNFFGRSGDGFALEGGADWATGLGELTLFARLGHQWIERNSRFGTPDYLWYGVGASYALPAGFTVSAGWYGTDIDDEDCSGGLKVCDGRFLASLSWSF